MNETNDMAKRQAFRAFSISIVCILTYLVSYYTRNLLSVSSNEMEATLAFASTKEATEAFIGTLSSVYMLAYAIGQLFNGYIGDFVKSKYMALIGLGVCGVCCIVFSFAGNNALRIAMFAIMGVSLSMLRGPLVKTICENTKSEQAHIACVFFSFTCSAGPLIASLIAMFFNWKKSFLVGGISCIVFGIIAFICLSIFEARGFVTYGKKGVKENGKRNNFFDLFKLKHFTYYMVIGMLGEIAFTAIMFWLPQYFTDRLGCSENEANLIFAGFAIIKAFSNFLGLWILKLFKQRDILMSRVMFILGAAFFLSIIFVDYKWANVALLLIALLFMQFCSTLLWNYYIPSQSESGLVSTLNGFLDFSGYLAASVASLLFAFTMGTKYGWTLTMAIWCGLAFFGFVMSFFFKDNKKKQFPKI